MHGIVLLEGLVDEALPKSLQHLVEREYQHHLGGTHGLVHIVRLRLDTAVAPNVAFELARALKPSRYYSRLNNDALMYVAFPGTVVRIERALAVSVQNARSVGRVFEVEEAHMRFDEMFELDHPEMHSDAASRAEQT